MGKFVNLFEVEHFRVGQAMMNFYHWYMIKDPLYKDLFNISDEEFDQAYTDWLNWLDAENSNL